MCAANAGVVSCNYNPVVEAIDSLQDELFEGDFDSTCLTESPDPAYGVECIQVLTLLIDAGKSCSFHRFRTILKCHAAIWGKSKGLALADLTCHDQLLSCTAFATNPLMLSIILHGEKRMTMSPQECMRKDCVFAEGYFSQSPANWQLLQEGLQKLGCDNAADCPDCEIYLQKEHVLDALLAFAAQHPMAPVPGPAPHQVAF